MRERVWGCYNGVSWHRAGEGQQSEPSCSVQGHISQVRTDQSKMLKVCLLRKKNFTLVFIDWLIQQMFTEHPLYATHCCRHWGYSEQTDKSLCPCAVEYSSDIMHCFLFCFFGFRSLLFRCVLFCLECRDGKQLHRWPYVQRGWVGAFQCEPVL